MKKIIGLLCLLLTACGKSKDADYYVLNPLPGLSKITTHSPKLLIGIDTIEIPGYLDKSELPFFYTPYRNKLNNNHEWSESLKDNVKRVVRTNLTLLLPGTFVEISPWNNHFKPSYEIDLFINQWQVSAQCLSIMQANYIIYQDGQAIRQFQINYRQTIANNKPETIAFVMNQQLTTLTHDMAKNLKNLPKK